MVKEKSVHFGESFRVPKEHFCVGCGGVKGCCCSVVQRVAVCCSAQMQRSLDVLLRCVAVCCSAQLQRS